MLTIVVFGTFGLLKLSVRRLKASIKFEAFYEANYNM